MIKEAILQSPSRYQDYDWWTTRSVGRWDLSGIIGTSKKYKNTYKWNYSH